MTELTKVQAREFILAKQGLLGAYRFAGKKALMPIFGKRDVSNMIR